MIEFALAAAIIFIVIGYVNYRLEKTNINREELDRIEQESKNTVTEVDTE